MPVMFRWSAGGELDTAEEVFQKITSNTPHLQDVVTIDDVKYARIAFFQNLTFSVNEEIELARMELIGGGGYGGSGNDYHTYGFGGDAGAFVKMPNLILRAGSYSVLSAADCTVKFGQEVIASAAKGRAGKSGVSGDAENPPSSETEGAGGYYEEIAQVKLSGDGFDDSGNVVGIGGYGYGAGGGGGSNGSMSGGYGGRGAPGGVLLFVEVS